MASYKEIQWEMTLAAEELKKGRVESSVDALLDAFDMTSRESALFEQCATDIWHAADHITGHIAPKGSSQYQAAKLLKERIQNESRRRGASILFLRDFNG